MKNEWFGISVYQEGKEKELKQATSQKCARASQRLAPTAPRETSKHWKLGSAHFLSLCRSVWDSRAWNCSFMGG